MARRIQPIFDSVLADARITGSERSFVESLQAHYQKRKSLSAGRRRCLLQIEERLKAAPEPIDSAMESRLDSVLSRATEAGDRWAMEFIPSLKGQLSAGRSLSARQLEILAKVETRHSDEARAVRDNWGSSFTSEMRHFNNENWHTKTRLPSTITGNGWSPDWEVVVPTSSSAILADCPKDFIGGKKVKGKLIAGKLGIKEVFKNKDLGIYSMKDYYGDFDNEFNIDSFTTEIGQ